MALAIEFVVVDVNEFICRYAFSVELIRTAKV
jgi:hypothetical protein